MRIAEQSRQPRNTILAERVDAFIDRAKRQLRINGLPLLVGRRHLDRHCAPWSVLTPVGLDLDAKPVALGATLWSAYVDPAPARVLALVVVVLPEFLLRLAQDAILGL